MKERKAHKKLTAIVMTAAMAMSVIPVLAAAETGGITIGTNSDIIAFERLTPETTVQNAPLGKQKSELNQQRVIGYSGDTDFGGGDGTSEAQAYEISTPAQLAKLAELVNSSDVSISSAYNNKFYKLMNDIDLSAYGSAWDGGKGWMPIGNNDVQQFKGQFNGNKNTITGLFINRTNYTGLFGNIGSGGIIKNIGIKDANITGGACTGGIAGYVGVGTVQNCYVTGKVNGAYSMGGIAGIVWGTIENCYVAGTVSANYFNVGGIAGIVYGTVKNCYVTGAVVGGTDRIGGIAGISLGSVQNCVAFNPDVTGNLSVGRVAGESEESSLVGNYAFSGMTGGGSQKTTNGVDGADLTILQAMSGSVFWKDIANWDDTGWTFANGKLPILIGFTGQSGELDIQYADATVNGDYGYTGATVAPLLKFGSVTLAQDSDYTYAITSADNFSGGTSAGTNVGEVTATLTGAGNFNGVKTATYMINKAPAPTIEWPTAAPVIYGASLSNSDLTGGSTAYGSFTWTDGNTVPTVGNSGYSVTFTPSLDTVRNYETITETTKVLEISVNKAPASAVPGHQVEIYRGAASTGNTVNLAALLPADRGTTGYGVTSGNTLVQNPAVNASGILTFDTTTSGSVTTENITVKAEMQNYEDATITIVVSFIDKKVSIAAPNVSGSISYGQPLSTLTISVNATADSGLTTVPGSITWDDPTSKPVVGTSLHSWTFRPDDLTFEVVTGSVAITVGKAVPQGTPTITQISEMGKTLADAMLTGSFTNLYDGSTVSGSLSWDSPDTTTITRHTVYGWTFTPDDTTNYSIINGSLTPYPGGGGSGTPYRPIQTNIVEVSVNGTTATTLPININKATKNSTIAIGDDIGNDITGGRSVVINLPINSDVNSFTLGISLPYLSTHGKQGMLTFNTDAGSITIPSNMLTDVAKINGSKAEITIGQGDKSTLPEKVRADIGNKPLIQLTLSIDGKQMDWSNPDAPVTVRTPYMPTAEELANPESIVVWYIDGSGKAVSVPNGHYNPTTGTVTFRTTHFSLYAVGYNKVRFNDVKENAWYSDAVSFIAARNITNGTGNGNYSPEDKLTREEFLVLLMKAYAIAPDENPTNNFSDAGNSCYIGYLASAKRLGLSTGVGSNMYAPGKEITRQEMFTMLYNTLKVIGQLPEGSSDKTLNDFTDVGQIDTWAKGAMKLFVETGLVSGNDGKVTPTDTTTRGEMAQLLYNLLRT